MPNDANADTDDHDSVVVDTSAIPESGMKRIRGGSTLHWHQDLSNVTSTEPTLIFFNFRGRGQAPESKCRQFKSP